MITFKIVLKIIYKYLCQFFLRKGDFWMYKHFDVIIIMIINFIIINNYYFNKIKFWNSIDNYMRILVKNGAMFWSHLGTIKQNVTVKSKV